MMNILTWQQSAHQPDRCGEYRYEKIILFSLNSIVKVLVLNKYWRQNRFHPATGCEKNKNLFARLPIRDQIFLPG